MHRSAPRLPLAEALLVALAVIEDAGGVTVETSSISSGAWRHDVALIGVPPLKQMTVPSAIHCSALCQRLAPNCSAITLLPGDLPICQLHEKQLCEDPNLSLESKPGARYLDVYESQSELAEEGGADCETQSRCSPRCYCPECPPPGFIPPAVAYECLGGECSVSPDYFLQRGYVYLPKWQEIATDGKMSIKKMRYPVSNVLRFEVRVSKIAEVTLRMFTTEWSVLTLGADGNTAVRYKEARRIRDQTVLSDAGPVLSTTEWFRISIICTENGCGFYGEDESTELFKIPEMWHLRFEEFKFASPLGVMAFWRIEHELVDELLMSPHSLAADPTYDLYEEGAFLRISPATSYDFEFKAAVGGDLWVEFREEYMWQAGKVIRVVLYPASKEEVAVYSSGADGSFIREDVAPLPYEIDEYELHEVIVSLNTRTVRVSLPLNPSITKELQISNELTMINYIGIGSDFTTSVWAQFPNGDPGWRTLDWKEGGEGYSTGTKLP